MGHSFIFLFWPFCGCLFCLIICIHLFCFTICIHLFTLERKSFRKLIKVLYKWKILITSYLNSIPKGPCLPKSCRQRDSGEFGGCEMKLSPSAHWKQEYPVLRAQWQNARLGIAWLKLPDTQQEDQLWLREGSGSRGFCHQEQIMWHPSERNGRPL